MRHIEFRSLGLGVFLLAVASALLAPAASARNADQTNWNAWKKQVTLANGQTISYVEIGDPDAAPLLLLHGISDTSRSFSLVARHLSGLRLLIPDQRGHGQSARPDCCYAISNLAWDAKLFLDALKVERAHVAGHSLGSMVAQVFAATWPERVDRLVLIDSTPGPAVTRGDWLWTEGHKLTDPVDPSGEFIRMLQSAPQSAGEDFLKQVRLESAAMPPRVWRAYLRELAQTSYSPLAPDIRSPVLILWGESDEMFGADVQAALRKALPGAKFKAFAGAGHNLHWDRPEESAAAMMAFFGD